MIWLLGICPRDCAQETADVVYCATHVYQSLSLTREGGGGKARGGGEWANRGRGRIVGRGKGRRHGLGSRRQRKRARCTRWKQEGGRGRGEQESRKKRKNTGRKT